MELDLDFLVDFLALGIVISRQSRRKLFHHFRIIILSAFSGMVDIGDEGKTVTDRLQGDVIDQGIKLSVLNSSFNCRRIDLFDSDGNAYVTLFPGMRKTGIPWRYCLKKRE